MKTATQAKSSVLTFPGVKRSGTEAQQPPAAPEAADSYSPDGRDADGCDADGYGEVFSRLSNRLEVGDAIAANERINAPIRYSELLLCSKEDRLDLVREDDRFQSYLLAEMLLERCREADLDELAQVRQSAELAVEISQRLNSKFYGSELKIGLEVRSHSVLGNILRKQGDYVGAEAEFERVDGLLLDLPSTSVERCDALSLKASLRNDQDRFAEAKQILDELVEVYRRTEDHQKLGKALIKCGIAQSHLEDLSGAIVSLSESLRILREVGDERLCSLALGNLARCLEDAGRSEEALRFLGQAREWMEANNSHEHLARARWLEGRIAASLERESEAEEAFQFARKYFSDRAIDIESASACLDLALLYAGQGSSAKLKELVVEMVPIFERQGLESQVMAALILLKHAAEKEIATLGLVQEIVSYVKRTQEHQRT